MASNKLSATNGRLVIGRNPVLACLRAGKRPARRLFILESGENPQPILDAAKGVEVQWKGRKDLDHLAKGGVHQGFVLEADPLPLLSTDAWLDAVTDVPAPLVLVLDGVEDPQNFGGIVRSAAAFGAHAVMFAQDRAAPLSPAALKAATGAMEYIDLIQAPSLVHALATCKERGFTVVGFEANGPQPIWNAPLGGPCALVIGSEGKGMRRMVRAQCEHCCRIPLQGPITSLNASVSAAIALAEWRRQQG